jgi:hypothetical protein
MATSPPLRGADLIDCARTNASKGIEVAAQRCGYREDPTVFEQALHQAGNQIGVDIQGFRDLVVDQRQQESGIEIAPDTPTQF